MSTIVDSAVSAADTLLMALASADAAARPLSLFDIESSMAGAFASRLAGDAVEELSTAIANLVAAGLPRDLVERAATAGTVALSCVYGAELTRVLCLLLTVAGLLASDRGVSVADVLRELVSAQRLAGAS